MSLLKEDLQTILLKKYQQKLMASFYILNYDPKSVDPEIWVNNFISRFTKMADHPDILKIKDEDGSDYKVDSIQIREFFKFINYKPLDLDKKFIFIFNGENLSTILCNKLLKTFEELGSNFCLFLIVADNAHLLPTVLSRGIKLQIPKEQQLLAEESSFSNVHTPQELLALIKNSSNIQDEKQFVEKAVENCLVQCEHSPESYKHLEELLKILSDNETYSSFNNSPLSRLTRFFS